VPLYILAPMPAVNRGITDDPVTHHAAWTVSLNLTMHPILEHLIHQHLPPVGADMDALRPFLDAVDRAYQYGDAVQELAERNTDLRNQLAERERSESHLEHLLLLLGTTLEFTADGILVLDPEGRVVRFNRRFIEMWRIPDEVLAFWTHDSLMQHLLEQVADPPAFLDKLGELCRRPEVECEDTFECHDGRVIERHSLPQFRGIDNVGRVLSFHDDTRRKRAEEALLCEKEEQKTLIGKLAQAHNQMLQSEKMASIGHLAAGVAHEINNPIGFVNSNLGALRRYMEGLLVIVDAYAAVEDLLPAGTDREPIETAKRAVDLAYLKTDLADLLQETGDGIARVRRIVQDLKDFSQAEQGAWEPADLHTGLESTLNLANNEIGHKAKVVREYGDLPLIRCLPAQLNQVFMNLLVNAAQAIEGQGVIHVRTGVAGEEVWVEIADTGTGIPAALLTRIFDPFFTTRPVGKGAGLGLSICYGIVRAHGGRIEVRSEEGLGATFRVLLPIGAETEHT